MAKMALRVYTREVEELIEHGQIKEGIAHARHILSSYPKYVDAYRLLGKAYLEEQLYGDAGDIFQRVLSAKPDDFISNVGMSIIREDEGNLDASIWHMERAFEVQPSNKAIQDELRRLFGRRDGLQPPKIRLTQGALARMYAHGNLYDQAIAEIQSALADDAQRHDLQILLAKMYYKSGNKAGAIDTCNLILEKLPFCLDANYIMMKISERTGQQEEEEYYRKTVAALDPYSAMTTKTAPLSENVAANSVTIEHLEWHPGMAAEMGAVTASAASLGNSAGKEDTQEEEKPEWLTATYEDRPESGEGESPFVMADEEEAPQPPEEELPDWMQSAASESEAAEAAAAPEAEAVPDWLSGGGDEAVEAAEGLAPIDEDTQPSMELGLEGEDTDEAATADDIPEFMQAAGWEAGSGEAEESPAGLGDDARAEGEEIARADIPDWLQKMKPEGADQEFEPLELADLAMGDSEAGSMDWLQTEAEKAADEPAAEMPTTGETAGDEAAAMDWLQTDTPSEEEEPTVEETAAEEPAAMDWLQTDTPSEAEEPTTEEPAAEEPAAMDWLQTDASGDAAGGEPEEPETESEASPAWMEELEQASIVEEAEDDSLDWLKDLSGEAAEASVEEETVSEGGGLEEVPAAEGEQGDIDWLSPEPEGAVEGEASSEGGFDWLSTDGEEAAAEEEAAADEEAVADIEAGAPEEMMDWMAAPAEETPAAEAFKGETGPAEGEDVPEWMQGMVSGDEPDEPVEASAETPAEEATTEDDPMGWLDAISEEDQVMELESETVEGEEEAAAPAWMDEISAEHEELSADTPEDAAQEPAAPTEDEATSDYVLGIDDSSMGWLEGLAAKQGAPEEELFSDPEERSEDAPDWLQGTEESAAEAAAAPSETEDASSVEVEAEQPVQPADSEEGRDEMEWLENLSKDELEDEVFGVRSGGDTSQLIRSLVFDSEGKPMPRDEADEAPAAEALPTEEPEAASDWQLSSEAKAPEEAPPKEAPAQPHVIATGGLDYDALYQKGHELVEAGDLENGLTSFSDLIKRGKYLDEIIATLQDAMVRHPIDISLYQTMGDAYMRADRLQDALDSYSKAEELLR